MIIISRISDLRHYLTILLCWGLPFSKSVKLVMVVSAIASIASFVKKAWWGVIRTLLNDIKRSITSSVQRFGTGLLKTDFLLPHTHRCPGTPNCSCFSASIASGVLIRAFRLVLMSIAPFFILEKDAV